MIKSQMFIAVALLVGVAIGFFAGGHGKSPADAAETEKAPAVKSSVSDAGDKASLKALRRRIAELEKQLAQHQDDNAGPSGEVTEVTDDLPAANAGEQRRRSPQEWMEELKKSDPVRFSRMTNHMARMRQRMAERMRSTSDFLASIDTSNMSASGKKIHDRLQELIAKRGEIDEQMQDENLTDEQRHELMESMRATDHEMRSLNRQERDNLIDATAKALGFEGEDAKAVSDTIQSVIKATEDSMGRMHGGPPPDGGGAPGGAAGGAPGGR